MMNSNDDYYVLCLINLVNNTILTFDNFADGLVTIFRKVRPIRGKSDSFEIDLRTLAAHFSAACGLSNPVLMRHNSILKPQCYSDLF